MELSVVTTLYHSEKYIEEFYQRIVSEVEKVTNDYEILFVDDGSPDNSLEIAKQLLLKNPRIKIIELSRNFGHHRAVMTGLAHARGDIIYLMDCDLEEKPEEFKRFWDEFHKSKDIDLIFGVQPNRQESFINKMCSILFVKFLNYFSGVPIHENIVMSRIMSSKYLSSLLLHKEKELVFAGLCAMTGYKQKTIEITKNNKGKTTYTLRKKINLAINYLTSLSSKPLVYIFYIGLLITMTSLFFILYTLFNKFVYNVTLGWTSIIASIWFFGGLIIFFLGILGIYLSKLFIEIKDRPFTIIKNIHQQS